MATLLRWLSAIFFVSALVALGTLLAADVLNLLRFTPIHRRAGALSFMLIGCSFVGLQFSIRGRWNERVKEILLGIGFLFWGAEQFLPPAPWVTVMDSAVVVIFVADLSLIIVERLKQKSHEYPDRQ